MKSTIDIPIIHVDALLNQNEYFLYKRIHFIIARFNMMP